ncbi:tRNA1(Val) (adenine(37)-N6)-methyltransferase [Xanthobacter sp. TB0139]|uniref:tRNA1(Val) (adenine(37)-N6)-methyltransferase n=1 Tax=Xanthobacter sp. TB0139 TaxID=3459178 RepID=UPI0040395E55
MAEPDFPLPFETTLDHVLGGRLKLLQAARGHRVGHDAILLAAIAPADALRMVDLGAGVGSAGLAFLARCPQAGGALVELEPDMARLARRNVMLNAMAERCHVVCADVAQLARPGGPSTPEPAEADLVLMNPPYNMAAAHRTSPHAGRALAHMAPSNLLHEWVTAASRCLRPAGMLCLIHRPAAIGMILEALSGRFGAIEILPVHARADAPAMRLLVRARKERRTAPVFLPGLVLADEQGGQTARAEAVLRGGLGLAD